MSLAQRVEAIFDNYLDGKDEAQCIQPLYPPPPRFDPVKKFSVPGKPPPPATFMNAWTKMDLSHLWGFPYARSVSNHGLPPCFTMCFTLLTSPAFGPSCEQ